MCFKPQLKLLSGFYHHCFLKDNILFHTDHTKLISHIIKAGQRDLTGCGPSQNPKVMSIRTGFIKMSAELSAKLTMSDNSLYSLLLYTKHCHLETVLGP